ncbi:MAG: mercury transporter [Alphaproteobacteria bacterium]|nr:MAG: mercury transporter [Alphaproteobacteria bacterium]
MSETTTDTASTSTTAASATGAVARLPADRGAWATATAALLGALAMTSCCILPLALVSLGVTGVFIGKLGALYQYHWYFLAVAVAALGLGFWKAYRPLATASCEGGACARPINRALMRGVLWLAAGIVLLATVFPYLTPLLLSY